MSTVHFSTTAMHRLLLALLGLSLSAPAFAQSNVPAYISYQGKITDAAGVPIGNTTPVNRKVIFRIWDHLSATTAGNRLYSEQQTVTVSGGEFSVLIGAGTPVAGETTNAFTADIFAGPTRYLGVTVDDGDENLANDPESSPRQQMVSTAFALRAQIAETVAAGSITSASLAPGAVGTAALGNNTVTTAILGNNTVTDIKLATGAVTTAALGNGTVTDVKLGAGAVTTAALGNATVTTPKLVDGAVTLAKLADNSVGASQLVAGAVTETKLGAGAVTTAALGNATVTDIKLAAGAVTTAALANANVTLAKLAANSVDSTKITDGSVALADLSAGVQDVLSKPRAIYNQAVSPLVDGSNWKLVPVDLGDLGNDFDGCRLQVIAAHKATGGSFQIFNASLWVQQTDMTNANASVVNDNRRVVAATWNNSGTVGSATVRLPPDTIAGYGTSFSLTSEGNDWIRFYNFYPGSLRSGDSNRENNLSTPQGPANSNSIPITSMAVGTDKLTITVASAHAIQVGDSVTIANTTGTPSANGTFTVTAQPDRTSFEIALTGAAGTYGFSGSPAGTVSYSPSFHRYRIWAAVHPNISARIIVSDR
jgi:hypothetical protein